MQLPAAHHRTTQAPLIRWVAASCALLVWLLGLLAASPELHAVLHQDADQAEHACAVTLFSQGVDGAVSPSVFTVTPLLLLDDTPPAIAVCQAAAPRYRLLPGRAPPVR